MNWKKKTWKWSKRLLLAFFVLLVSLLFISASWHQHRMYKTNKKYPMPGELVDVGGQRLHCMVSGRGKPVVVAENGIYGFCADFWNLEKELSDEVTFVNYDRAGAGWSGPAPATISFERSVEELRTLLTKLDLAPPYILVGGSLGGMLVRLYAAMYPDEVRGLVLVDPLNIEPMLPELRNSSPWFGLSLLKNTAWCGSGRVLLPKEIFVHPSQGADRKFFEMRLNILARTMNIQTMCKELVAFWEWPSLAPRLGPLGDMPVALIIAESFEKFKDSEWHEGQDRLRSIADQVNVVKVDCSHHVPYERPDVIANCIRAMIEKDR